MERKWKVASLAFSCLLLALPKCHGDQGSLSA